MTMHRAGLQAKLNSSGMYLQPTVGRLILSPTIGVCTVTRDFQVSVVKDPGFGSANSQELHWPGLRIMNRVENRTVIFVTLERTRSRHILKFLGLSVV